MQFFSGLSNELFNSRKDVQKKISPAMEDANQSEADATEFNRLLRHSFYTTLAHHEQGRANHMMIKTTFDSFQ